MFGKHDPIFEQRIRVKQFLDSLDLAEGTFDASKITLRNAESALADVESNINFLKKEKVIVNLQEYKKVADIKRNMLQKLCNIKKEHAENGRALALAEKNYKVAQQKLDDLLAAGENSCVLQFRGKDG